MVECAFCRRSFAAHFVVEVFSKVRWRGNSFDAYQAQGKLGLAVAKALGYDPTKSAEFAQFVSRVSIRDFREKPGPVVGPFNPDEGETWEFHVGFNEAPAGEQLAAAQQAAVTALREIQNYVRVELQARSAA
ncbi:MAG TPA: hypothetical protein VNZ52_13865 [Candidatus Thermoplasmatota archaeon]|nr:hypothetical protein [Candidatus Thermoplasmatota archaeon]